MPPQNQTPPEPSSPQVMPLLVPELDRSVSVTKQVVTRYEGRPEIKKKKRNGGWWCRTRW